MSGGRPRRRPARLCSLVGSRLRSQALFRLAARAAASSSPRRSKPPDPSARNLRGRLRRRMRRSCRGSAAFSSRSRPRKLRYASRVAPQFDRLVRKACGYELFRCQIVVSSEAVDAGATAIRAPTRIYVVLGHGPSQSRSEGIGRRRSWIAFSTRPRAVTASRRCTRAALAISSASLGFLTKPIRRVL